MLCKMKAVLLVLLILRDTLALPTIEDNKIPTDQEVLGQPEEVSSLGLPSDEESFNHLSVFFNPPKPPTQVGSGTYHFVSSTFPVPEVDARGFHESVFDGIGDYFPSWPAPYKRDDPYSFTPSLAQRLGLQPRSNLRKRSQQWTEPAVVRKKRARTINPKNTSQDLDLERKEHPNIIQTSADRNDRVTRLVKREVSLGEDFEEKGIGDKNVPWGGPNKSNEDGKYTLEKRSGARYVRGMEMGSSGFHGDIFNRDFGDFTTMRKRARGALGFHGDTFSDGFGDFATMKRSLKKKRLLSKLRDYFSKMTDTNDNFSDKRSSETISSDGEEDTYDEGIYGFDAMKKRKPEMTSMGFHGDTFTGGFGDFYPVKKRKPEMDSMGFHGDTFSRGFGEFEPFKKRRPEMDSMGFHGDTFTRGFGEFEPYKKRRPATGSMGFHGDTFSLGFGDFDTYKKRRPEMDSMGFHGDTFSKGFGDFDTYKKRRPMGSMGFHGDTFSQGFGDFDTYKKRRPMGSMGFHGDTFSQGFGDFDTYKKRKPEMDSMGFHGDTFSRGFGDFDPYKKRRPEMDSMGFHGDTFNRGFGDFDVYKKRSINTQSHERGEDLEVAKTEDKKCCSDSSIHRHPDVH